IRLFSFFFYSYCSHRALHSFPTRRSSDLANQKIVAGTPNNERRSAGFRSIKDVVARAAGEEDIGRPIRGYRQAAAWIEVIQCNRSEEHTSELQSRENLVCRLLLEKKNKKK